MKTLPITQKDFDDSVIIANFISEIRDALNENKENYVKFTPKAEGYDIYAETKNATMYITIHKPISHSSYFKVQAVKGLKVKKYRFKDKASIKGIVDDLLSNF